MTALSPFTPREYPKLPPLAGVKLATAETAVRYQGRPDLLLVQFTEAAQVAGVFTRSATAAAPVQWCREILAQGTAKALVVNAGNANACTGPAGIRAVEQTVAETSRSCGVAPETVYIASTGVIGEPLPVEKMTGALPALVQLARPDGWEEAAQAIMTTDTYPKLATRQARLDGKTVTLNGIAKGSGMIAPDMATMLGFLFTDAAIEAPVLQQLLHEVAAESFNAITVDGDTSTNDTVLLFATGGLGNTPVGKATDRRLDSFRLALLELAQDLALQIVRDGEGISKLVTVEVADAADAAAARKVAGAIANSPLVKTAIAGEDPNWGRILMAVGKAGVPLEQEKLALWLGDLQVVAAGMVHPGYSEERAAAYMRGSEVEITVSLGAGDASARVWTCDLTHAYISINADYRS